MHVEAEITRVRERRNALENVTGSVKHSTYSEISKASNFSNLWRKQFASYHIFKALKITCAVEGEGGGFG
jgi:hypothetical protein